MKGPIAAQYAAFDNEGEEIQAYKDILFDVSTRYDDGTTEFMFVDPERDHLKKKVTIYLRVDVSRLIRRVLEENVDEAP